MRSPGREDRTSGRVEDLAAVVTGAGSGIGEATARLLAAEGAAVLIADVSPDSAERVTAEIIAAGGTARAHQVDVSDEDAVAAMVATACDAFGRLDIVHNNAAATSAEDIGTDTHVVDLTTEQLDRAMRVNLYGAFFACKHAVPRMLERGGSIVNTSSLSSLEGDLALSAYAMSKAALNALTRSVATQYGRLGIRCNTVVPGLTLAPSARRNLEPEVIQLHQSNLLTPFAGEPDDIAELVVFLASPAARYITGSLMIADGGQHAHKASYGQFDERGWMAPAVSAVPSTPTPPGEPS